MLCAWVDVCGNACAIVCVAHTRPGCSRVADGQHRGHTTSSQRRSHRKIGEAREGRLRAMALECCKAGKNSRMTSARCIRHPGLPQEQECGS